MTEVATHQSVVATAEVAPSPVARTPRQVLAEVVDEIRADASVEPEAYQRETRVPADGE